MPRSLRHLLDRTLLCSDWEQILKSMQDTPVFRSGGSTINNLPHIRARLRTNHRGLLYLQSKGFLQSPRQSKCNSNNININRNHHQGLSIRNLRRATVPMDPCLVASLPAVLCNRKKLQPMTLIDRGGICNQVRLGSYTIPDLAAMNLFPSPERALGETSNLHVPRHFYNDRRRESKEVLQSRLRHSRLKEPVAKMLDPGSVAVHHQTSVEEVGASRVECPLVVLM